MTHDQPIIFTLITYDINNYVFTYFSKNLVINYQDYELRIYTKIGNYQAMYSLCNEILRIRVINFVLKIVYTNKFYEIINFTL